MLDFEDAILEIKSKLYVLTVKNYDHFAGMRMDIDLRFEELIENIGKIRDKMIKRCKKLEVKTKRKMLQNVPRVEDVDFEREKSRLATLFSHSNVDMAFVHAMNDQFKRKINQLEWDNFDLSVCESEFTKYKFESGLIDESIFGKFVNTRTTQNDENKNQDTEKEQRFKEFFDWLLSNEIIMRNAIAHDNILRIRLFNNLQYFFLYDFYDTDTSDEEQI